jgi:hypothetical protein
MDMRLADSRIALDEVAKREVLTDTIHEYMLYFYLFATLELNY